MINLIKTEKKSFFIIEKIQKYRKCPALEGSEGLGWARRGEGALGAGSCLKKCTSLILNSGKIRSRGPAFQKVWGGGEVVYIGGRGMEK